MTRTVTRLAMMCSILALGAAEPAAAATLTRHFQANGGNACTGALPTYEGALRKRPKAIANEGTTPAFVTCSMVASMNNVGRPTAVVVAAGNATAAAQTLQCTLVNGSEGDAATTSYPFSFSVPAFGRQSGTFGSSLPSGQFAFQTISISCALAPGMSVTSLGYYVAEDVGN